MPTIGIIIVDGEGNGSIHTPTSVNGHLHWFPLWVEIVLNIFSFGYKFFFRIFVLGGTVATEYHDEGIGFTHDAVLAGQALALEDHRVGQGFGSVIHFHTAHNKCSLRLVSAVMRKGVGVGEEQGTHLLFRGRVL